MQPGFRVLACGPEAAAHTVAGEIGSLARERAAQGRGLVLGLAAGRSPLGVYAELARLHAAGELSLAHATSFNLDVHLGLDPTHPASFQRGLEEHLLAHVDLPRARAHFPAHDLEGPALERACEAYERAILGAGGIDLQLLGIGRNGHIAFNEPGCADGTRTRRVELAEATLQDAARDFGGLERVPLAAVTMGVATILDARRIRMLAFGASKRAAVQALVSGPIGSACPASFLRRHGDCIVYTDAL